MALLNLYDKTLQYNSHQEFFNILVWRHCTTWNYMGHNSGNGNHPNHIRIWASFSHK